MARFSHCISQKKWILGAICRLSPIETKKCQSNSLAQSIAAQSSKLQRIALKIKKLSSSIVVSAFGWIGDEVSKNTRIHQTVQTFGGEKQEV